MKLSASLLIMLLVSCASTQIYDEKSLAHSAAILGMVYDADRRPVGGVTVTSDTPKLTAVTDIRGHFALGRVDFGPVTLNYSKDGYESSSLSFLFSEPSQVAYIQLMSRDQLFDAVLAALEAGNLEEAEGLLHRADAFQPRAATHVFLRATLLTARRQPQQAVDVIQAWLKDNPDQFTLELMLADLWEKSLQQPELALGALDKALMLKSDPAVRARMDRLQGKK